VKAERKELQNRKTGIEKEPERTRKRKGEKEKEQEGIIRK